MTLRPRGSKPGWMPSTPRQEGILADVVARYKQHYDDDTLPRSPRGIFYDLRPSGRGNGITYDKPTVARPPRSFDKNTEAHPAAVQEVLVLARRAGIIPESWVADTKAPSPMAPLAYEDADEFAAEVADAARNFALPKQRGQPVYIEVMCEAADLQPRLARVAGEYGVPVYSGGGFDGMKGKRAFANRALARDVPTVVLSVGDRDKSGEDIYRSVAEDAASWAGDGRVYPIGSSPEDLTDLSPRLTFFRLALTTAQAEALDLLDENGKGEVDGVPVPVMDRLLTDAIEGLQVPAYREGLDADEERERGRLPDAIRQALGD